MSYDADLLLEERMGTEDMAVSEARAGPYQALGCPGRQRFLSHESVEKKASQATMYILE